MAKLTKDELVTAIQGSLDQSVNFSSQALQQNRKDAWDYYLGRPRGDEMAGRSKVQDTTVRDTVHALLAQIMPSYSTDHPIKFEPAGPDDIDQAEAESSAVNNLFTEGNMGYLQLHQAVHDCLLFRNGVIKVWVEEKDVASIRRFNAAPADVIASMGQEAEIELMDTDDDGVSTFSITQDEQKLIIETIEPAYFFVDPNQSDQDMQKSRFLAELTYLTRSELLEMGINRSIVKELPATPDKSTTQGFFGNTDIVAKSIAGQTDINNAATRDQDNIEAYWIHMLIDRNGKGISQRYRFLFSHRKILLDEPVDFVPYASGTGWPVPHRWSGLSVYDLTHSIQNERTNARRQLADNLNVANNQRPIYDPGETEAEDISNGAPGRGIRSRNPGNVAFMPIQDIVSQSISFLQYTDKIRGEQTGTALDLVGEGQTMKQISGISAEIQLQPQEMMAALVSRNIAETLVRNIFVLIHRTLRTQWDQPIMFSKSGDWQMTQPSEWMPRNRLNVSVGLSPGERRRQNQALQFVIETQMGLIQGGTANITTTWSGVHSALSDWMKSAELDGHEGYFLDPDGEESQQGQQAAQQQQQAEQQKNEQLEQMQQQLVQMQMQIEQQKVENERNDEEQTLRFKYWEQLLQADVKEREIEQQADAAVRQQASIGSNGTAGPGQRDSECRVV